jgi:glycosyltransferase 2 family protein
MRLFLLLLKISVTVILLWLIARNISPAEVRGVLAGVDLRYAAAGVGVLALQPLLGALRWFIILRRLGGHISGRAALAVTYVATVFNQALPATVASDAIRIWLCHRLGIPLRNSVTSVALDRATMLLSLVLVVAIGAVGFAHLSGTEELEFAAIGLLIAGIGGITLIISAEALPRAWQSWRAVRALTRLAADTRSVLFTPGIAAAVLGLSVVALANMVGCILLFSHAVAYPLTPLDAAMLIPPVILASVLPISLGGWGSREFAMIAAFATVGIPSSASLVISIMFGISSILVSLPGVPCYIFLRRSRSPG